MKRSWQIWLLYAASLAVALPALVWLTWAALAAQADERATRQQARRDEQIRLASWRIDTMLMPIITPQAARSYDDYLVAKTRPTPKYVLSYFELSPQGVAFSPPTSLGGEEIEERRARLSDGLSYGALVARLPHEMLPADAASDAANLTLLEGAVKAGQIAEPGVVKNAQIDDDYLRRQKSNEDNTLREIVQQRAAKGAAQNSSQVEEGVSRPVWVGGELLVARRVSVVGSPLVVGCWLDWKELRTAMKAEVADLLANVELLPVRSDGRVNYAHTLAALPVELSVPPTAPAAQGWTALRVALLIAWAGLIAAALATAFLLAGSIALARRREAFVSAVTHELRTPLTTFRMYSEMLDAGMVSDEAQRKDYLRTLRVEADRLWHLVENVLAYARLERGRLAAKRERLTVAELWSRVEPRLSDRATQAGLALSPDMDGTAEVALVTDPPAVEQILFNLVDNACKHAADAKPGAIHVAATAENGRVEIRVRDHGSGVRAADAAHLFRPFSKTTESAAASVPGVGLGLALCRRLARQMGGDLRYESTSDQGATFVLTLPRG